MIPVTWKFLISDFLARINIFHIPYRIYSTAGQVVDVNQATHSSIEERPYTVLIFKSSYPASFEDACQRVNAYNTWPGCCDDRATAAITNSLFKVTRPPRKNNMQLKSFILHCNIDMTNFNYTVGKNISKDSKKENLAYKIIVNYALN